MLAVMPPAADPSALPRSFGPYTLFDRVGKGGMAQIYLARAETDLGATRLAVVKEILPAFADDPRFAEMLTHEAKLAARLSHRHIVQVFDLGRHDGHLYIAMEYVEGFDLNGLLRLCSDREEGLPAPHALGIVADVLAALDYAHRRTDDDGKPLGIVHRDVSPSNVLISFEGEVKLCDFGIAHANDVVTGEAGEALVGKAGYMSPEHAAGEPIDARADVFAAGIILWELLAGRRLYRPRSELSLLEQARRAEVPALPDKGLPDHARLVEIVERALARDREQRYPSAVAFLRDLEAYLGDRGLAKSRLELGKWIASTFGTELVERRRASERRLPAARSSERMRVGVAASLVAASGEAAAAAVEPPAAAASAPAASAAEAPTAAAPMAEAPMAEAAARDEDDDDADSDRPVPLRFPLRDLPVSEGALRAFVRELESSPSTIAAPESLAGATLDVESSRGSDPRGPSATDAPSAAVTPSSRRALVVTIVAVAVALAALVALARGFVQ